MRYRGFILFIGALAAALLGSAWAQDHIGSKTLLLPRPMGQDPIRVLKVLQGATELKGDGRQFPDQHAWETVFQAGDDWLQSLSFFIKNVSTKKITYLEVGCSLFESSDWTAEIQRHKTPDNPAPGQISNNLGRRPEHALHSPITGRALHPDTGPQFELAPGGEIFVPLSDPDDYQRVKMGVERRMPISNIHACEAFVGQVFFEDGTRWSAYSSSYYRAADEPGRWTPISLDEWLREGK
jgi:hypothetical protein